VYLLTRITKVLLAGTHALRVVVATAAITILLTAAVVRTPRELLLSRDANGRFTAVALYDDASLAFRYGTKQRDLYGVGDLPTTTTRAFGIGGTLKPAVRAFHTATKSLGPNGRPVLRYTVIFVNGIALVIAGAVLLLSPLMFRFGRAAVSPLHAWWLLPL